MNKLLLVLLCSTLTLVKTLPHEKKPKPIQDSEDDDYYTDEGEEPIPKTSFTCQEKIDGFYADIETNCRVFHYCQTVTYPDQTVEQLDWPFSCPPTTIFRQEFLTCTSPHKSFNCSDSESYYDVNQHTPPPTTSTTTTTSSPPPNEDTEPSETTASSTTSTTTASVSTSIKPSTARPSNNPPTTTVSFLLPPFGIQEFSTQLRPVIKQYSNALLPRPTWFAYQKGPDSQFKLPTLIKKFEIKSALVNNAVANKSVWEIVDHNVKQLVSLFGRSDKMK